MSRLLFVLFVLGLPGLVVAQQPCELEPKNVPEIMNRVANELEKGNYAHAYCSLKPLAEEGIHRAQYLLGWMYHHGYGLAIDDSSARRWWMSAAELGNTDALFALGAYYELGEGAERRAELAASYYLDAARRGHEESVELIRALVLTWSRNALRAALLEQMGSDWSFLGPVHRVTSEHANIRRAPNGQSRILRVAKQGDDLVELERTGSWYKVAYPQKQLIGWVHTSLFTKDDTVAN